MKTQLPLIIAGAVLLAAAPAGAGTLDLTGIVSSGSINGALFTRSDQQSTGSGVIDPFVRISSNNPTEAGYNATARPVMPDDNTAATFTHDIQLSTVGEVLIGGTVYYEFLLDINQNNSDPLLSLDQLQIYTRSAPLANAGTLADLTAAPSVLRYNLDAGTDSTVLLNYKLNSGSGSGDLFLYVPKWGGSEDDYLYLYSQFGATGGNYINNDGYEEWATRPGTATLSVPDGGSTLMLLGAALIGMFGLAKGLARQSVVS